MAKEIRKFTAALIFVIIVAAFTAIAVTNAKSVGAVSGLKMTKSASNSISFQWDKIKKADGYYLYRFDESKEKYVKLAKNEGYENCKYKIENLSGATVYKIKVYAYKNYIKKEYKSTEAEEYTVYSLPSAPTVNAFSSAKGVLSVEWKDDENLSGYEVQYSKNSDFSENKDKKISDASTRNFTAKDLNPGDVYYTRVRGCLKVNEKDIYGEWSETAQVTIYDRDVDIGNVDPNKPMVAFSFDDGPAYKYNGSNSTERILNTLEKYGARATFFMVGERVNNDTKYLLEKEIALGCELGNHTYSHNHYGNQVTASDISKASDRIKKYSGQAPTIFRCPGGNITSTIRKECKSEGMPLAYWSVDTEDWRSKDKDKICEKILNQVYDGAIVLMHDIYPSTADAVEKIVPQLIENGYQIVTVSELIKAKTGEEPEAGKQYVDYKTINNNTK